MLSLGEKMEERDLKFKRYGPNAFRPVNILGWWRESTMYCTNPRLLKQKNFPNFFQQRKVIQNVQTEYEAFSLKLHFVKNRGKHWQCAKEYANFLTLFKKVEHCSLPPEMYFDNFQADGKEKEIISIPLGRMWHSDFLKPRKRFINLKN